MCIRFCSSTLRARVVLAALIATAAVAFGCGGTQKGPAEQAPAAAGAPAGGQPVSQSAAAAEEPLPPPAVESQLPEGVRAVMSAPFTGDFDEMVKRRVIRLGVTYNRNFYFIDKGVQRGAVYEYGKLFEDELNKKLNTGNMKVNVVVVPLPRHMMASALLDGRIDAVVAQFTITPDKQKLVDFTAPTRTNVTEVVVTGPGAPAITTADDLSRHEVFVRKDGTYHQSLLALNGQLKAKGKPPVKIQFAADNHEDDDLLEMANAGLIPITVVDSYLAPFWKKIFTGITVHDSVAVRTGGEIAVAIRKNSPQFKAALDEFLPKNGLGSAFRNMMEKRYLVSTTAEQKVGDISQTEANIHAGVKYMRFMMDQYFKDAPMDQLNKGLFTFASYNAGPGRIRQLRKEAEKRGWRLRAAAAARSFPYLLIWMFFSATGEMP